MAVDMMAAKWLQLPASVLLAVFAYTILATGTPAPTSTGNITQKPAIATTGSGPEYASACWKAITEYDQSSSSWTSAHQSISNTSLLVGGTSFSYPTYYENATTLCDGHARVTYSPAISISSGTLTYPGTVTSTSTIVNTYFSDYPKSRPTCEIAPSDCDGLWKAYSTKLSAAGGQTTNPPLETPPCMGQKAASSYASVTKDIYGCGECTIFGEGVELVYFPTYPSSRDMCAMTPSGTLTHYGPGAVITAYAGKSYTGEGDAGGKKTAVADGHTFTSGTAYISISTVYAVDRCSKTFGTPVKDAILAMPSESVLSLRYSQDHFQRLMSTDQVTGYPVSYADFNTPIPWSAWNGQNMCDPGGYGGWACSIIYEHSFRPQLAIPPEITQLSPDFKNCQMWYNGLWDPPLALTEAASEAQPTLPGGGPTTTEAAAPNPSPAAPTSAPTALPNDLPSSYDNGNGHTVPAGGPSIPQNGPTPSADGPSTTANQATPSDNGPTIPADGPTLPGPRPTSFNPAGEPWSHAFRLGQHTYRASAANNQCRIGSVTLTAGGPTKTLEDGTQASYGSDGLILKGHSTVGFDESSPESTSGPQSTGGSDDSSSNDGADTVVVAVNGGEATAVQSSNGGPVVIGGSMTLTAGAPATTFSNGQVLSAATNGLVIDYTSTVGKDQTDGPSSGSSGAIQSNTDASRTSTGSREADTTAASATVSGEGESSTGSASSMSAAQALSLFAAIFAMVVAGG